MDNMEVEVIDYLDMHSTIKNKQMEVFSISKLKQAFPELDEFTLKKFESKWREARQVMMNIKF